MVDDKKEADRMMLQDLLDACLDDSSHIAPLYLKLQNRVRSNTTVTTPEHFDSISTFGRLPEDLLISGLVSRSDMSSSDIIAAKRVDDESVKQLIAFELAFHPNMKMPDFCKIKQVADRCLTKRSADLGGRLANFKAQLGLRSDGSIDWSKGVYTPASTDGLRVTSIAHLNGESVVLPAHVVISVDYQLHENWSDVNAYFFKEPMPPIKVVKLFAKDKGPNQVTHFGCKVKLFLDFCKPFHDEYSKQMASLSSTTAGDEVTVQAQLKDMQHTKRIEVSKVSRVKAIATLEAKKHRRSFDLQGIAAAGKKPTPS
jgi:hypothetical protein